MPPKVLTDGPSTAIPFPLHPRPADQPAGRDDFSRILSAAQRPAGEPAAPADSQPVAKPRPKEGGKAEPDPPQRDGAPQQAEPKAADTTGGDSDDGGGSNEGEIKVTITPAGLIGPLIAAVGVPAPADSPPAQPASNEGIPDTHVSKPAPQAASAPGSTLTVRLTPAAPGDGGAPLQPAAPQPAPPDEPLVLVLRPAGKEATPLRPDVPREGRPDRLEPNPRPQRATASVLPESASRPGRIQGTSGQTNAPAAEPAGARPLLVEGGSSLPEDTAPRPEPSARHGSDGRVDPRELAAREERRGEPRVSFNPRPPVAGGLEGRKPVSAEAPVGPQILKFAGPRAAAPREATRVDGIRVVADSAADSDPSASIGKFLVEAGLSTTSGGRAPGAGAGSIGTVREANPVFASAMNASESAEAAARAALDRAVQVLTGSREGNWRVTLRLDPPELGQLHVHARLNEGALSLQIRAESEAVRQIVESRMTELRGTLGDHGIRMERAEIMVRGSAEGGPSSSFNSPDGRTESEARWMGSHNSGSGAGHESGSGRFASGHDSPVPAAPRFAAAEPGAVAPGLFEEYEPRSLDLVA